MYCSFEDAVHFLLLGSLQWAIFADRTCSHAAVSKLTEIRQQAPFSVQLACVVQRRCFPARALTLSATVAPHLYITLSVDLSTSFLHFIHIIHCFDACTRTLHCNVADLYTTCRHLHTHAHASRFRALPCIPICLQIRFHTQLLHAEHT